MSQIKADNLVRAYIAIRDDLAVETKKYDAVKAGHKQKMGLLEAELKKICDATGSESLKTSFGTASLSKKDFVKVSDWPKALDYIKSNDLWHLLTKSVSKAEVKDFMEGHDNQVPPGLDYGMIQALKVSRPAKKKGGSK